MADQANKSKRNTISAGQALSFVLLFLVFSIMLVWVLIIPMPGNEQNEMLQDFGLMLSGETRAERQQKKAAEITAKIEAQRRERAHQQELAEAEFAQRLMEPLSLSGSRLDDVSTINSRRNLPDPKLPSCSPPDPLDKEASFASIIALESAFDRDTLAIRLSPALILAAAVEVYTEKIRNGEMDENQIRAELKRLARRAAPYGREDQMTIALFHWVKGKTVRLEGIEPSIWSEQEGEGRLIAVSTNALSGTRPGGAPMLLTFQRRVCLHDNSYTLRLQLNVDWMKIDWKNNLQTKKRIYTFSREGSLLAAIGEASRQHQLSALPPEEETDGWHLNIHLGTGDIINIAELAISILGLFI